MKFLKDLWDYFLTILAVVAVVIISCMFVATCDVKAEPLNLSKDKALIAYVDGDIDGRIASLAQYLDDKSNDYENLWLLINSPGGSVEAGGQLILAMHKYKHVRCLVTGQAQSMAFIILTACNDRYAFPHTRFMFHAAYNVYEDGYKASIETLTADLMDLRLTDVYFRKTLQDSLKVDFTAIADYYKKSFTMPLQTLQTISPGWIIEVNDLHIK